MGRATSRVRLLRCLAYPYHVREGRGGGRHTKGLTLRNDDINLPLVRGSERLLQSVHADPHECLVFPFRVVLSHCPHIWAQILAKCEVYASGHLLEYSGDPRLLGGLCLVKDPTDKTEADG